MFLLAGVAQATSIDTRGSVAPQLYELMESSPLVEKQEIFDSYQNLYTKLKYLDIECLKHPPQVPGSSFQEVECSFNTRNTVNDLDVDQQVPTQYHNYYDDYYYEEKRPKKKKREKFKCYGDFYCYY